MAAGFTPEITFATDDYVAVQRLVAVGLGVALLPELVLGVVQLPGVLARPLVSTPERQILAITPAAAQQPPAVAVTLAALQAASTELANRDPGGVGSARTSNVRRVREAFRSASTTSSDQAASSGSLLGRPSAG